MPIASLVKILVTFALAVPLEKVHPLQSGILRLKHPEERRPGLARQSAATFWPRYLADTTYKFGVYAKTIIGLVWLARSVVKSSDAKAYSDKALTPVDDVEEEAFDLVTKTTGGPAAVAHSKKVAKITSAATAA